MMSANNSTMNELQKVQADTKAFNQLLPSRRMEHERNMANTDRTLRTASVLAHHTLLVLWTLASSRELQGLFLRPEMVERISHSINHYVFKLSGPERKNMIVLSIIRFLLSCYSVVIAHPCCVYV
jgi:hypothetical protein